jgi:hypothetical protein
LVPSTSKFLALEIVFHTKKYAQEFDNLDIKKIVLMRHFKAVLEKVSTSKSRVVIHIISDQLQEVYDNLVLNKRSEIKAFYLSANGPNGKHDLEVHLVSLPRPMLAACFSKSAGHESLSRVQCFNSYSPIATRSSKRNYDTSGSRSTLCDPTSTTVIASSSTHCDPTLTSVVATSNSRPTDCDPTSNSVIATSSTHGDPTSTSVINSYSPIATRSSKRNYGTSGSRSTLCDPTSTTVIASSSTHCDPTLTSVVATSNSRPTDCDPTSNSVIATSSPRPHKRKRNDEGEMESMNLAMKKLGTDCEVTKRVILLVHFMNQQPNPREIIINADNGEIKFGRFLE